MAADSTQADAWLARCRVGLLATMLVGVDGARAQSVRALGTFHNIGVEVDFATPPPPELVVGLSIKQAGEPQFRPAHPLARIADTRFAGSAFDLQSGTAYLLELNFGGLASNAVVAVSTRSETIPSPSGPRLHVDPGHGNDRNGGESHSNAFRTLHRALRELAPGVTLLLHGGRYREGDLEISTAGTATNPIVIRNAPGEHPVIDGTASGFVPTWSSHDSVAGLYASPCSATPANAYLNGEQLYRYDSYEDLRAGRWNQESGFFADGTTLFVRFPGGGSPGAHVVTLPACSTGLTLLPQVAFVQVVGLEFCYLGYAQDHRGIDVLGAQSNLIDHCTFRQVGVAVSLRHGASFNTIQHCTVSEAPLGRWSWQAVKEGGTGYEAGGVGVYGGTASPRGNVVRSNVFSNMFDGAGLFTSEASMPTTDMDVHDNLFTDCCDDAVETDGSGTNVRIYRNRMENVRAGVSVAPCGPGPTYIMRNVVGRSPSIGTEGRMPIKFNGNSPMQSQWIYLYHNTCFSDVPGQAAFVMYASQMRWTNVIARNNIFVGMEIAFYGKADPNPIDFDYDNHFATGGALFGWWLGQRCQTFKQFQQASGQEAHGWSTNPGLVDPRRGNYSLRISSPMVDRGVSIPGVNDVFAGRAPDLGAFELEAPGRGGGQSALSLGRPVRALPRAAPGSARE